jgi:uncharacterized protein (DUF983 family)
MQNTYIGFDGALRVTVLLLSMTFTIDIIGLSIGLSCTHSRPIWMHLIIWSRGARLLKAGSVISIKVPDVQCSHT